MDYFVDLMTRMLIFGSAASIVAYLAEEGAILNMASAGLLGVGSYAAAISTQRLGFPLVVGLLVALSAGVLAGFVLHLLTQKLAGVHMAMATLAATVILNGIMLNWVPVTAGPMGIADIPRIGSKSGEQLLIVLPVAILVWILVFSIPSTIFGLRVRALRDDEILSEELLLKPRSLRMILFVGSSCLFSLLGGLYAYDLRYVDPSSFTIKESISILAMALIIPAKSSFRGFTGAALFILIPELLRLIGLPATVGAQIRQALFGFLLLIIIWKRLLVEWYPKRRE